MNRFRAFWFEWWPLLGSAALLILAVVFVFGPGR